MISLNPDEYKMRVRLKTDFPFYAPQCLKILTSDGLNPFALNRSQIYLYDRLQAQLKETGKIRAVVLKSRKVGISTEIGGYYFQIATHTPGTTVFIFTHKKDSTSYLYNIVKRFYDNCPEFVKPRLGAPHAKELIFPDLDSQYSVGTAGSTAVGRGFTIKLFHWSEMAFSDNAEDHFAGIMQAIPPQGFTASVIESTANGNENHFHHLWEMTHDKSFDYQGHFIPWYWDEQNYRRIDGEFIITPEEMELKALYTLSNEQLNFRRFKIKELSGAGREGEKLFKQEFPSNPQEAFISTGGNSIVDPDKVEKARRNNCDGVGPLIVGVDPAWEGRDLTAIIKRRGRRAYDLQTYQGKSPMEVVNLITTIIRNDNPDKIFIDVVGLGAGIIDRLRQLGYSNYVFPVNGGSKANNDELYVNKNAEMWALMAEWFNDEPVSIPDDQGLIHQLCSRGYEHRELNHKLVLQSKKELSKSPDKADALAMTFAFPVGTNAVDWKMYYNPTIKI